MNATDVVAYTYQADIYHPGRCIVTDYDPWAGTAEDEMNAWAERLGIDRTDESTYDSDEFPKVVFADQANELASDHCAACGELILS